MSTIHREKLLRIAQLVRPALAAQAYIPALTHIAFGEGYALTFNDVSAIRVAADAVEFDACLPGDLLIKALNSFGGESVAAKATDAELLLSSGRSKLKLPTLPLDDFPFQMPSTKGEDRVEIGDEMLQGLTRCLVSVGNDPTHPATMGVTLQADGGKAALYSTDNYSISRASTSQKISLPGDTPVILPTFFCEQVLALAKHFPDATVTLYLLSGGVLADFEGKAQVFTKTLVDLEPLDFDRIITKNVKLSAVKDLLAPIPTGLDAAVGRALLVLGSEADKTVKFSMRGDTLKLEAQSGMGSVDESLDADEAIELTDAVHVDPVLLSRAAKNTTQMAFLPKALLMANKDFLHLIAYCAS